MKIQIEQNEIRSILQSEPLFLREIKGAVLRSAMKHGVKIRMDNEIKMLIKEAERALIEEYGLSKYYYEREKAEVPDKIKQTIKTEIETQVDKYITEEITKQIDNIQSKINEKLNNIINMLEFKLDSYLEKIVKERIQTEVDNRITNLLRKAKKQDL